MCKTCENIHEVAVREVDLMLNAGVPFGPKEEGIAIIERVMKLGMLSGRSFEQVKKAAEEATSATIADQLSRPMVKQG